MRSCTFVIKDHAWMLEYGRGKHSIFSHNFRCFPGLLPLSLPFQMTGAFFASLDFVSMFRLQFIYAKYLLYELLMNHKV